MPFQMTIAKRKKQSGMTGVFVAVILVTVIASAGIAIWMGTKNNTMLMWAKSANQARALSLESFQKMVLRDAQKLFSQYKTDVLRARDGAALPIAGWKKGTTETSTSGDQPIGTFKLVYNSSDNSASSSEDHSFAEVTCVSCIKPASLTNLTPDFTERQTVKFSFIYSDLKGGSQVSNATYLVRPETTSDLALGTTSDGMKSLPVAVDDTVKNSGIRITESCPSDSTERAAFLAKVKTVNSTKSCTVPAVLNASTRAVSGQIDMATSVEKAALDAAAQALTAARNNYNLAYSKYLLDQASCTSAHLNIYTVFQLPIAAMAEEPE